MIHSIGQMLQKGELAGLTQQAQRLKKISILLQEILPTELAQYTHPVCFAHNCLLLEVSNSSTATLLRYYIPTLLSQIRQYPEFASIASIKQQVKPVVPAAAVCKKTIPPRTPYSKNARLLLAQVADKIQYEPLKLALLKLSEHLPKQKEQ